MDLFARRKGFLVVEIKENREITNLVFLKKLEFLQKQYRYCFNSIHKHPQISPEFVQGALFFLDYQSKFISCLINLISSDVGCKFLDSLLVRGTKDDCFFGSINEKFVILKTYELYKENLKFLFNLNRLGLINANTFFNMSRLKNVSESVGLEIVNDIPYYEVKKMNVIDLPEDLKKTSHSYISDIEKDFYDFVKNPIVFKKNFPVFWSFLSRSYSKEEMEECINLIIKSSYKYDVIRSSKSIPLKDSRLIEGLDKLDSFERLYNSVFEFSLMREEERLFFIHILIFFLSQSTDSLIFDEMNANYINASAYEKTLSAIKFIDMIVFVSDNSMKLRKALKKQILENFKKSLEINLSILKNRVWMDSLYIFHFPVLLFMVTKIKELKSGPIYNSECKSFFDPYFEVIGKFLNL